VRCASSSECLSPLMGDQRPRAKPLSRPRLPPFSRQPDGRPSIAPSSPIMRDGSRGLLARIGLPCSGSKTSLGNFACHWPGQDASRSVGRVDMRPSSTRSRKRIRAWCPSHPCPHSSICQETRGGRPPSPRSPTRLWIFRQAPSPTCKSRNPIAQTRAFRRDGK